ncbi:MAG: trehalose-phosphatase [Longimicrobiales bacterium]
MTDAFERVDEWLRARRDAGALLLALDFDGTLAPIVPRPADARIVTESRTAIRRLVARGDTHVAVVSGRALDDARARLDIEGLYLAGNHGLEIEGPGVARQQPEAAAARPALVACAARLAVALADHDGVEIEDKGLTLSVHYRRATSPGAGDSVRAAVARVCDDPALRASDGKMVVEIRPDVDWDKGRATRFLLDTLGGDAAAELPAIFIGDDRTDEDAFRALRDGPGSGVVLREAVLVSAEPGEDTAATCAVRSPDDVARLLDALARGGT